MHDTHCKSLGCSLRLANFHVIHQNSLVHMHSERGSVDDKGKNLPNPHSCRLINDHCIIKTWNLQMYIALTEHSGIWTRIFRLWSNNSIQSASQVVLVKIKLIAYERKEQKLLHCTEMIKWFGVSKFGFKGLLRTVQKRWFQTRPDKLDCMSDPQPNWPQIVIKICLHSNNDLEFIGFM
jgi:hypothetical protein